MESKAKKHDSSGTYRKAPQAPRRFKSPYILFSISKMQEYKTSFKNTKVTSFSSQISKEWRQLPPSEREKWKVMAEQDKRRYDVEKSQYTGPWVVRFESIRKKRPKDAPKRPPSAFLNYCQKRRAELKMQHPDVRNTDISKMLGEEWKNAATEVRQPHIDKEAREREDYYKKVAVWKEHHCKGEDLSSQNSSTVGKSGTFLTNNEKVRGPLSPPAPVSTALTANLCPRPLPTPPNEMQKIVHSSMFHKPSLVEGLVSSISSWDGDANIDDMDANESLIPTLLPPPDVLRFPSESVLSATTKLISSQPNDGIIAEMDSDITLSTTMATRWPSDVQNMQNLYFPSIFQGDTSFDPPFL